MSWEAFRNHFGIIDLSNSSPGNPFLVSHRTECRKELVPCPFADLGCRSEAEMAEAPSEESEFHRLHPLHLGKHLADPAALGDHLKWMARILNSQQQSIKILR